MITIILIMILLFLCSPHVDYYKDYRNNKHVLIWYNWFSERKFIHYEWAA